MFKWGIMGAGFISSQFAKGLAACNDMKVYAVASLSGKNPFQIEADVYYDSYEAMANDPEVDAIYIGTIHPMHMTCAKIAINAGKPVLCEKTVAMNAKELKEVLDLAEEKGVFFMEAMWSRFLPSVRSIRKMLTSGEYGKPQMIHIDFGSICPPEFKRIFDPKLGGGALLDVGVYGINLARFWLDAKPAEIHAWSKLSDKGIDLDTSVQLCMDDGTLVDVNCSIQRCMDGAAHIVTDKSELLIPYFWRPLLYYVGGLNRPFEYEKNPVEVSYPLEGNGYGYEAMELRRCLMNGLLESPDMTWAESLEIMENLDEIRRQGGIVYPED